MSQEKPINELTNAAMSNLRTLVDVNTIIGDPISTSDGITIIPFSKVSFGYGTGGSDLPVSTPEKFAGATGGGVTLQPLGFIIINNGSVEIKQLYTADNTSDRIVNAGASAVDRILGLIPNKAGNNMGVASAPAAKPEPKTNPSVKDISDLAKEMEKDINQSNNNFEPDGIALSPDKSE